MKGDLGPAEQSSFLFQFFKQLQLVEISVHVLEGGYAVFGGIGETATHDHLVGLPLFRGRPLLGLAAGLDTEPHTAWTGKMRNRLYSLAFA